MQEFISPRLCKKSNRIARSIVSTLRWSGMRSADDIRLIEEALCLFLKSAAS